jgi:hypothetical protein
VVEGESLNTVGLRFSQADSLFVDKVSSLEERTNAALLEVDGGGGNAMGRDMVLVGMGSRIQLVPDQERWEDRT